jgi:hypothetical protein
MRPIGSLFTLITAASLAMAQAKPVNAPQIPTPGANAAMQAGSAKGDNTKAVNRATTKTTPFAIAADKPSNKGTSVPNASKKQAKLTGKSDKTPQSNGDGDQVKEVAREAPTPRPVVAAKFGGKRDPFVSIIKNGSEMNPCGTGKKCLVPSELTLRGCVQSGSDKFAVVENSARRTYFLREKDPVFNGQVVRITHDEVVFREMVIDRVGRAIPREIVKRLPKG